jgi:hypothetical protein
MKHLLLLFFCCVSTVVRSQTVFPGPGSQTVWNIGWWRFFENAGDTRIDIDKDTVICNQKWTRALYSTLEGRPIKPMYYRIQGAKVFIKPRLECESKEYLMYDFDMKVGDSLVVPHQFFETDGFDNLARIKAKVETVTTVTINGVGRKKITLNYFYSGSLNGIQARFDTWIEGMGSVIFPFYPFFCVNRTCNESNNYVRCFQSEGKILYQDSRSPFCSNVLITANEEIKRVPLRIFPNPLGSAESMQVDVSSLPIKPTTYKVYDLLGRAIAQGKLSDQQGAAQMTIPFNNVPTGVYHLQLLDRVGRQLALEKVVK